MEDTTDTTDIAVKKKKKRKRAPRGHTAEVEYRIDMAEQLLLQGLTHNQSQKVLKEQFSVCRRTSARYVSAAYARWKEAAAAENNRSVNERRKEHEWMIRRIVTKAGKENRLDLQLKAVDMLMRLYGTPTNSRLEVTGRDGGPIQYAQMTTEELERLILDADVTIEALT